MNCPACKGSYHDEKVWLECEFCHQWYHADCAGYSGWIEEDLQLETFCPPVYKPNYHTYIHI